MEDQPASQQLEDFFQQVSAERYGFEIDRLDLVVRYDGPVRANRLEQAKFVG